MNSNYTGFARLIIVILVIAITSTSVKAKPAANALQQFPLKTAGIFPLDDTLFPPQNLYVDDMALIATWDAPTSQVLPVSAYHVYLDGDFLATIDTTVYAFNPDIFYYGSAHVVSVDAVYTTGTSAQDTVSFSSHYLYPPKNLLGTSVESSCHLTWQTPVGAGGVPLPNLLQYNIYEDGTLITNISGTENDFWVMNLPMDSTCFELSAIYDLTPYGFPGETSESIKAGPACISISFSNMPYREDWITGSFATNEWIADSNWRIAEQMGNPMPSAEFGWDPPQTDYTLTLESCYIYPPTIQPTTFYKIWADFDLLLNDSTASGSEYMTFDVWNGATWDSISSFQNNGDTNWVTQHLDISSFAKNHPFKIRFRAQGENSGNIKYWLVDNIDVYIVFIPPQNLISAQKPGNKVHLAWQSPVNKWIHYDNGENATGIGTGGIAEFNVAMRFTPSQLADYDGWAVKRIKFFPLEAACTYAVKVWSGADAANLLVEQAVVSPSIGEWNEIDLSTFATIDVSQELWIGYSANTTTGYPAGCDAGPADAGFGDLLSQDGGVTWVSIANEYGLDFNWNIQGYIEESYDSPIIALPLVKQSFQVKPTVESFKLNPENKATGANLLMRAKNKTNLHDIHCNLIGYNIYRHNLSEPNFTLIGISTDTEYDDINLPFNNCYFYYVTLVYNEGESIPSNMVEECLFDHVKEIDATDVNIFPNPASKVLTIEYSDPIVQLSVFSILGTEIYSSHFSGENKIQLNTSGYPPGSYILHVIAADGSEFYRRFLVAD
ncbi:MAG: T9SS type A sorting domain-containing protein [Bacteroidales bacterium]